MKKVLLFLLFLYVHDKQLWSYTIRSKIRYVSFEFTINEFWIVLNRKMEILTTARKRQMILETGCFLFGALSVKKGLSKVIITDKGNCVHSCTPTIVSCTIVFRLRRGTSLGNVTRTLKKVLSSCLIIVQMK